MHWHVSVIQSNALGADNAHICQSDNLFHTSFLQQKFSQMFFIPTHINPEHFRQIVQELLEIISFSSNHLARPRLQ